MSHARIIHSFTLSVLANEDPKEEGKHAETAYDEHIDLLLRGCLFSHPCFQLSLRLGLSCLCKFQLQLPLLSFESLVGRNELPSSLPCHCKSHGEHDSVFLKFLLFGGCVLLVLGFFLQELSLGVSQLSLFLSHQVVEIFLRRELLDSAETFAKGLGCELLTLFAIMIVHVVVLLLNIWRELAHEVFILLLRLCLNLAVRC